MDMCEDVVVINLYNCTITSHDVEFYLSRRELAILRKLLESPNGYCHIDVLVSFLQAELNNYHINKHSVEESIRLLRKKLGESGRNAHILRLRHGVGYGLFTQQAHIIKGRV